MLPYIGQVHSGMMTSLCYQDPGRPVKHATTVCVNCRGCTRETVHLQRMLSIMPAGMLPVLVTG